MVFLLALFVAAARPPTGERQVVVVMKNAACPVCAEQMVTLKDAEVGAQVMGITHDPAAAAARVSKATGVPTWSHAPGIRALGLWVEERQMAQPAVVVYDRCGEELGRVVGRAPGLDATNRVKALLATADDARCKAKPQT